MFLPVVGSVTLEPVSLRRECKAELKVALNRKLVEETQRAHVSVTGSFIVYMAACALTHRLLI